MGQWIVTMIDESEYMDEIWALLQPPFEEYAEGAFDTAIAAEDFMRDKAIGIIREAGYIVDLGYKA